MNSQLHVSNNKYSDCPPRMDDARHFTDYRPVCHVNNMVRVNNSINNSYEYRMFLTQNATKLMDLNRSYACSKNCCGPCVEPYNQGTMLPEQSIKICNNQSCNTDFVNAQGLGEGRQYDTQSQNCGWSDPKVSGNNLNMTKSDMFSMYGKIDSTVANGDARKSMPSGGDLGHGGPEPFNL